MANNCSDDKMDIKMILHMFSNALTTYAKIKVYFILYFAWSIVERSSKGSKCIGMFMLHVGCSRIFNHETLSVLVATWYRSKSRHFNTVRHIQVWNPMLLFEIDNSTLQVRRDTKHFIRYITMSINLCFIPIEFFSTTPMYETTPVEINR